MENYMASVDKPYGSWTLDEDEMRRFKYWMTYDPIHWGEPLTPLGGTLSPYFLQQGYLHGAERTSLPPSKGVSSRVSPDGYLAMSEAVSPTPEEMEQRGAKFGQFMGPFLERFDELWGDFRHKGKAGSYLREVQGHFARLGAYDQETWTFDLAKYNAKLEGLLDNDLYDLFQDAVETERRLWEIHFELMYVVFSIYMIFEGLTTELFGFGDTDPRFQRLMQGFDNHVYDCDRGLWRLAHSAAGLGLADVFTGLAETEVIPKIKETDNGRKWLSELDEFLLVFGIRCPTPFGYDRVRWNEDPSAVVAIVRDYILKGLIDYDAERKKIVDERERTIAEVLEKVPEARKEEFKKLLKLAQTAYSWNEDHNYWIEQAGGSAVRPIILEMGKRLHKAGAIAEPNDIFFINWDEVRATFALAVLGKYDFREFVERRKAAWKAGFAKVPPKVTGEWVREEVRDPVMIKVFGLGPMAAPAEKVDVFGYPGAPGVVEGVARVITAIDDIGRIETGAILVTGATGPAWTPVFSRIKGVVTDHGGSLSHAAIVGREYGMPAVVGTGDSSVKIKDGQRIRVDGDRGLVYILG